LIINSTGDRQHNFNGNSDRDTGVQSMAEHNTDKDSKDRDPNQPASQMTRLSNRTPRPRPVGSNNNQDAEKDLMGYID
jgi:hypothetical protein